MREINTAGTRWSYARALSMLIACNVRPEWPANECWLRTTYTPLRHEVSGSAGKASAIPGSSLPGHWGMAPFSLQPDRGSWVGASYACELMTTTTIFDNLVVKGYDPKKIPN